MLNDLRSHGLWAETAPVAPPTTPLAGDFQADVAIVGAGYTGLSAALHLRELELNAVVLEAAEIGFGGSGRNVGLVNAGMWSHPDAVVATLGAAYGNHLLKLLGDGPALVYDLIQRHGMDCEPVRNGTLHLAVGHAGIADITARHAAWQKRGAPVSLLDSNETAQRVGSEAYAGALLDLRAGTIQPLGYARGLARAAIDAGATIHTQSAVAEWTQHGDRHVVRTAGGSVTARWVIVATNAYTHGPWSAIDSEIIGLPYFNFATAPLRDSVRARILPGLEGAWDTKTVLNSFRLDGHGRLIFGSVGALRNTGAVVHRAWARRTLQKLFPEIGPTEFESAWYGRIGMTDNDLPKFHEHARRIVSFSGYNGRGIAPGTVFGKLLAEYIRADGAMTMPLPKTDIVPVGTRAIRSVALEAGAQLVHLVENRR